jgi:hypothetical protein
MNPILEFRIYLWNTLEVHMVARFRVLSLRSIARDPTLSRIWLVADLPLVDLNVLYVIKTTKM